MVKLPRMEQTVPYRVAEMPFSSGDGYQAPGRALEKLGGAIASAGRGFAAMAEGMTAASIYNRMIMPTSYGVTEAEYWRLINGVSQWDVGVERQVQLKGPDAGRLAQILSPRDLTTCKVGRVSMYRCAIIVARSSTIRSC